MTRDRAAERPPVRPPARSVGRGPVSTEEVLESISDAFYAVDHEWRLTYVNRVAEAWWGQPRKDLLGKALWSLFPHAVGAASYEAHLKAAREREVVRVEVISPTFGHWVDVSIFPNPHGLSVYFRDISDRKQEEARQLLLINELNHRVKNTLATVQAIAAQSLRGADVPPAARERFMDRLMALSQANDLILRQNWRGARLLDLIARVLSPHMSPQEPSRFVVSGPDMLLKPKAATSLALALHELSTNAAKYGALATPSGSISLTWEVAGELSEAELKLVWMESGGPRVEVPAASGFGMRLLKDGLRGDLRAQVRIDYPPSGAICTIVAPMAEVAA